MLVDNILSVYDTADPAAIADGMGWYHNAHEFAASLDRNVERSAGIIAALSPLNSWANNKRKAQLFYDLNGEVKWNGTSNGIGLSRNVRKAERIWQGESPYDVITADKTRNFFLTITDPDRTDHIPVIDRHAFDIANGSVGTDAERGMLKSKGVYAQYAEAYREAADRAGIPVQCLQAITWVEWRERIGKGWAG